MFLAIMLANEAHVYLPMTIYKTKQANVKTTDVKSGCCGNQMYRNPPGRPSPNGTCSLTLGSQRLWNLSPFSDYSKLKDVEPAAMIMVPSIYVTKSDFENVTFLDLTSTKFQSCWQGDFEGFTPPPPLNSQIVTSSRLEQNETGKISVLFCPEVIRVFLPVIGGVFNT